MYPCNDAGKLPTISMYAGATKTLCFPVINKAGNAVDVYGCTARFSVVSATNRSGRTVIAKNASAAQNGDSTLVFTLDPADTINLEGKYIYQVWIIGADGSPEEPQQGELYVRRNIDKAFYSN